MTTDQITNVECMTVELPLDRALWASGLEITKREFFVVRVTTEAGYVGHGFHKSRGMHLNRIVTDTLKPLLVGRRTSQIEWLWDSMCKATAMYGRTGAVMRAIGTVDIALWDLRAQQANIALHQMLGGYRSKCDALLVTGYYEEDGSDVGALTRDLRTHFESGFRFFKIAGGMLSDDVELKRLNAAREAIGPECRLVVDVNWVWNCTKKALRTASLWDGFNLEWIEEPFPPGSTDKRQEFARRSMTPLGIGDEQCGLEFFRDLMINRSVDVVRCDTPVLGGITPAIRLIGMCAAFGLPVSPHIYPEINVHLAAAFKNVLAVELFSTSSDLYQIDKFLDPKLKISDGSIVVPDRPGLGFTVDWDALSRFAS